MVLHQEISEDSHKADAMNRNTTVTLLLLVLTGYHFGTMYIGPPSYQSAMKVKAEAERQARLERMNKQQEKDP